MRPPRYDEDAVQSAESPYPAYAALRAAAPLCRGGPGQWVFTRHADIAALLRDPRLGSAFPLAYHRFALGDGAAASFFHRILLYRDPPAHTRLRGLFTATMGPAVIRGLAPGITRLVAELLEPARQRRQLDVIEELAYPLPILVMCELLGIPGGERDLVRPHALALGAAFATRLAPADRGAADAAVTWLRDYLGALVRERRARPLADVLSRLAAAAAPAGVDDDELIDNLVFLFFAGFETTSHLIGNGAAALAAFPAEQARLRADTALLPTAIEELLRFEPPIQGLARLVLSPIDLHDVVLRPQRAVVLLIGSANRDPDVFADPDRLDLTRHPNPHLGFGGGIHGCLGAGLARLETAAVIRGLLDAGDRLEPAAPPRRAPHTRLRGFAAVPLRIGPG